jgi:hypothetical protein
MLENVHYIGCVRWDWRKTIKIIKDQEIKKLRPKAKINEYVVFNGKHDGIVSEELFKKAKEIRGQRHRSKTDTTLKNPLSGLMVCKKCGSKIGYNTYVRKGVEYAKPKLRCNNQVRCKTGAAEFDDVLNRVCAALKDIMEDFEIRIEQEQDDSVKLHKALVERLEKKLEELNEREKLQWEAKQHPDPEERMPSHIFKELNGKLLKEREEINEALCKARESVPEPVDYRDLIVKFSDAYDMLQDPSIDASTKNRHLKTIIDKIEYERPPAIHINKSNYHQYGYQSVPKGRVYHWEPYEITIKIK